MSVGSSTPETIAWEKVTRSGELGDLATALAKAQGEIKAAIKAKVNPHFKSKYADLDACWDVAREPLSKNHLAVVQWPSAHGRSVTVETWLMHASGQWMCCPLTLLARDESPQAVGSAITYGRRYGFSGAIGITSDEDDDGNAASQKPAVRMERNQSGAAVNEVYTGTTSQKQRVALVAQQLGITDKNKLIAIADKMMLNGRDMKDLEAIIKETLNAAE